MVIVRLKTERDSKMNELLRFTLPSVDYTKGYQPKPRPELNGGSAAMTMNSTEPVRLKAVNELLKWISVSVK